MPLKISVELSHICPLNDISAHAKALESHGFHRIWIPDTVTTNWEAWIAASLITQQSKQIQIGLGVTNPYTRHPVVVAQMATTLQHCSGGRLSISLGKGINRFLEKAGVKQRATAVAECATVLRHLMHGERTSHSGASYQIDAMRLRTPPATPPVPIYIAAIGETSWANAMPIADGIATVWNENIAVIRQKFMREKQLPCAVLIPFAQTRTDFFASRVSSLDQLQRRIELLEQQNFDEVIIAYADREDLETAAQLIK